MARSGHAVSGLVRSGAGRRPEIFFAPESPKTGDGRGVIIFSLAMPLPSCTIE